MLAIAVQSVLANNLGRGTVCVAPAAAGVTLHIHMLTGSKVSCVQCGAHGKHCIRCDGKFSIFALQWHSCRAAVTQLPADIPFHCCKVRMLDAMMQYWFALR